MLLLSGGREMASWVLHALMMMKNEAKKKEVVLVHRASRKALKPVDCELGSAKESANLLGGSPAGRGRRLHGWVPVQGRNVGPGTVRDFQEELTMVTMTPKGPYICGRSRNGPYSRSKSFYIARSTGLPPSHLSLIHLSRLSSPRVVFSSATFLPTCLTILPAASALLLVHGAYLGTLSRHF